MRLVLAPSPFAAARRGDPVRRAADLIAAAGHQVQVVQPSSPDDYRKLVPEAARDADVVVAAGGDGTASLVASSIVGTPAALAILPLGRGNDLARTLGMRLDLPGAVEDILTGRPRPVDLGYIEGTETTFVNICGIGFDAAVAERINRRRSRLSGATAYTASLLAELARFRPPRLRLRLDDRTIETRAMLVAVANARSYGGGMCIAPAAQLDDGLLDVCVVEITSKAQFLANFPKVFRGTHVRHPLVHCYRAKGVAVEGQEHVPVMVDGDLWGEAPVTFGLRPRALPLIVPPRPTTAFVQGEGP